MAGLFVSGHRRSMQGAGMKALKISSAEPLKSRRSTALSSSHSSRGCSSIPRACRAQLAPRARQLHGQGGSPEEAGLGSPFSRPASRAHLLAAHGKWSCCCCFLCWAGCGLSCGLQLWGRLSFLQPRALFTSVQLWGPPNAAQLLKAKMSSKQCELNCPPTSVPTIPSNKMSTSDKAEWGCKMQSTHYNITAVVGGYILLYFHGKRAVSAPGKALEIAPHLHRPNCKIFAWFFINSHMGKISKNN